MYNNTLWWAIIRANENIYINLYSVTFRTGVKLLAVMKFWIGMVVYRYFFWRRYKPKMKKKLKKQSMKVCGKPHKVSSINYLLALFAIQEERKSTSQYFYLFWKLIFIDNLFFSLIVMKPLKSFLACTISFI